MTIGRQLREARGWSRAEVGAMVGRMLARGRDYCGEYVRRAETPGGVRPGFDFTRCVARLLGCSMYELRTVVSDGSSTEGGSTEPALS
jgi:hypothetical protein